MIWLDGPAGAPEFRAKAGFVGRSQNDVHIIGVSSLTAGHLTLVPLLKKALVDEGRDDVMIVVGGVIPPDDHEALHQAGASAIFPPGTVIAEAAIKLLQELSERLGYAGRQAAE